VADVNVNDILLVTIGGQCFNQRILFTQTYRVETAPSTPTSGLNYAAAAIAKLRLTGTHDLVGPYLNCMCEDYTANFIRAQIIKPVRSRFSQLNFTAPGGSGTAITSNLAATVTLNTLLSGRDQTATKHVGPIATEDSVAGLVTNSLLSNLDLLGDTLIAAVTAVVTGSDLVPCIWHSTIPGPTIFSTDVNSYTLGTTTRVMRRRTVGRGE